MPKNTALAIPDSEEDLDFFQSLAKETNREKARNIDGIIKNFRLGDASSIKLVTEALLRYGAKDDQSIKITDEQFQNVILLAADRIKDVGLIA